MFRKIVMMVVIILLAAWLGASMAHNPGYVLLAYGHWTVEMSVWVLLALILALWFSNTIMMGLIATLVRLIKTLKDWPKHYRQRVALKKTNRGLSLLAQGKWRAAEKYLVAAAEASEQPLVHYLAAAKAAQEQASLERRDRYLVLAQTLVPDAASAIHLTQAELQLSYHQLEPALITLRHLYQATPKNRQVLELLVKLYRQFQNWQELANLLPCIQKYQVYPEEEFAELQREVYQQLIEAQENQLNMAKMLELWEAIPKPVKSQAKVLIPYVKYLLRNHALDSAEALIRWALKMNWQPELVKIYGVIHTSALARQLQIAEYWLEQHQDSPILMLTLARLAKANQLWGKARHYLQQCLELEDLLEARFEYAELLYQLNEHNAALQQYRQGATKMIQEDQNGA